MVGSSWVKPEFFLIKFGSDRDSGQKIRPVPVAFLCWVENFSINGVRLNFLGRIGELAISNSAMESPIVSTQTYMFAKPR